MKKGQYDHLAYWLLILGGLNWLAFGLLGWEVGQLFGTATDTVPRVIYVVIGLAAVYKLLAQRR